MKIAIMTVFFNSDVNWDYIQNYFINKNTNLNVEKFCVLNKVNKVIDEYKVVDNVCDFKLIKNVAEPSANHMFALDKLFDFFKNIKEEFDYYILLDSDCFPIRKGWLSNLIKLCNVNKQEGAAIFRTENISYFPHPSMIFFKKNYFLIY